MIGRITGTGPLIDGQYRPGLPQASVPKPAAPSGGAFNGTADRLEREHKAASGFKYDSRDDALEALGQDQRDKLKSVERYLRDLAATGRPEAIKQAQNMQAMLDKLLMQGKLEDRSAEGTTVLDELKKTLAGSTRTLQGNIGDWRTLRDETGMTPKAFVLQAVLEHLTDPRSIYQGDRTSTCGATTVQSMLAEAKPAEYARLVCQLLDEGSVVTAAGDLMSADVGGLGDSSDGRSHVEDLLQESFMSLARNLPELRMTGDVDLAQFGNGRLGWTSRGRFGAVEGATVEEGLTAAQMIGLSNSVMHGSSEAVFFEGMDPKKALDILQTALKAGPVPIGVKGDEIGHAVLLESIRGTEAYLRDPADPDGKPLVVPAAELMKEILFASVPAGANPRLGSGQAELGWVGGGGFGVNRGGPSAKRSG
ncbi:MAG: hypothetical protein VKP57_09680 [Candidatus Sericytochromatia bacterium]|nr:hypothetical protein [Candidatus Sericytochromatia bacterium]